MEINKKISLAILYGIVLIAFAIYYYFFSVFSEYYRYINPQNYMYRIEKAIEAKNFQEAEKEIQLALETFRPPDPELFTLLEEVGKQTKKDFSRERLDLRKNVYKLLSVCDRNEIVSGISFDEIKTQLISSYNLGKNQRQMIRLVWKALVNNPWKCLADVQVNESHIFDFLILSGAQFCFNSQIGTTGVQFEEDIIVLSEGGSKGSGAQILYQGRNYGGNRRGFYVVLFTPSPHKIFRSDRFDVWESRSEANRMAQFLEDVPDGYIGVFAVSDEASENMTPELENFLISYGFSKKTYHGWERKIFGYSYAFAGIGVKGAKEGSAIQNWAMYDSEKNKIPVAIVGVLKGKIKS